MPGTRKLEPLAKKFIKAIESMYDTSCAKMAKEASEKEKAEILKTNTEHIKKMIKKEGLEKAIATIKLLEQQAKFMKKYRKNSTRKKGVCEYNKKQGSYIFTYT